MADGFGRDDEGRLLIAGRTAQSWVDEAGDTPLFLYDWRLVERRIADFRAAMPKSLHLHYAMKANPYPPLLQQMAGKVDGFDIASAGELRLALAAGVPADAISFAGPGKRDDELRAAISAGITLNIESEGELERAGRIAHDLGLSAHVALRVNPPFALKGSGMKMGGLASPFGVDADKAVPLLRRMCDSPFSFRGLHLFAGSQALSADAILESQRLTVALAGELAAEAGVKPPLVNLGGGFGVPYFPGDKALSLTELGDGLADILEARPAALSASHFALELGRYLVAEAGVYLTRVIDRKESGSEVFVVTDGGLHHQLAASGNFGTVIRRNYPVVNASGVGPDTEVQTIVGCLCTPLDRLADKVELKKAEVGDLIAVFMAGAYGRSASPESFLGHSPAMEALVGA